MNVPKLELFFTGKFLIAGSNGTMYNRTLKSPLEKLSGISCLRLAVAKFHLHPYAASFLRIQIKSQYIYMYPGYNYTYDYVLGVLEVNDYNVLNTSWQHYDITIVDRYTYYAADVFLEFSATTYQAYIAVDNVEVTPGVCQSGKNDCLKHLL